MLFNLSYICHRIYSFKYFCLSRRYIRAFYTELKCILKSIGNPKQLIHPTDNQGNLCGTGIFYDRPYLYYFDWTQCIKTLNIPANVIQSRPFVCPTRQVCVQQCPNKTSHYTFDNYYTTRICTYDVDPAETNNEKLVNSGKCAPYVIASKPLFGRCIPETIQSLTNDIIQVDFFF